MIPFASTGVFVGSGQKKFIASFDSSEPSGFRRLIVSFWPAALTPLAVAALPSTTACAPTMPFSPVMKATAGDCIFGLRMRLIAKAKFAAVNVWPVLDLMPLLTVKV